MKTKTRKTLHEPSKQLKTDPFASSEKRTVLGKFKLDNNNIRELFLIHKRTITDTCN